MAIMTRREALQLGTSMGLGAVLAGPAFAQQQFFRIGTGGTAGTYYPVGGLIAQRDLHRQDRRQRGRDQRLGGQRQRHRRRLHGVGLQPGRRRLPGPIPAPASTRASPRWRSCAPSPTSIPRACTSSSRKGSGIKSVADLKGKRVSLDEPGSGTLVNAAADPRRLRHHREGHQARVPQAPAGRRKAEGRRRSTPSSSPAAIRSGADAELAATTGIELLPIDGAAGRQAARPSTPSSPPTRSPPAPTRASAGVKTLSVGAQWVTSAKIDAGLVYEITKGLWSDKTRAALDAGHAKGKIDPQGNRAARRSASRCIPAPRSSTRKPACRSDARCHPGPPARDASRSLLRRVLDRCALRQQVPG